MSNIEVKFDPEALATLDELHAHAAAATGRAGKQTLLDHDGCRIDFTDANYRTWREEWLLHNDGRLPSVFVKRGGP